MFAIIILKKGTLTLRGRNTGEITNNTIQKEEVLTNDHKGRKN